MGALDLNVSSSQCRKCGAAYGRMKGNFAVSYSQLYKGAGYLPYCKQCVDDMYNTYFAQCKDPKKAVRQMCRKLDLYWSEDIYSYVNLRSSARSIMTAYIARANSTQYIGRSYDDTLMDEGTLWDDAEIRHGNQDDGVDVLDSPPDDAYVDPEIRDFWGADFAPDFILKLDKRYKDWTGGQDGLDKGSISLFKQICILEETIARDAAAGRPVDKNMNTLNTLLGSANLKPVQKKSEADLAMENTPLGVWIDRWEHKRPIPEPDPAFKDVDGIIRYITIWFYGHISKTLGIKNVYCEMYEKEMARMKVERPDFVDDDDDDESNFNSIFGSTEV